MDATTARRLWAVGEPVHALTYFAPESRAAWEAAGLRGFWRGYFATRAAPLGAVGAPVVRAGPGLDARPVALPAAEVRHVARVTIALGMDHGRMRPRSVPGSVRR